MGVSKRIFHWLTVVVLMTAAAAALYWQGHRHAATDATRHLILLLPDADIADKAPIRAWQDAAQELGINLDIRTASQLLHNSPPARSLGLILPDMVHRTMSDVFIQRVRHLVDEGAALMLVHDAGQANIDGRYAAERSRLSDLAGVEYALYSQLRTGMAREALARVSPEHIRTLGIPPGKLVFGPDNRPFTSATAASAAGQPLYVAGYMYGPLRYQSHVTRGQYRGIRMMDTDDGSLLAGLQPFGRGRVLFVNLPLTQLKLRTDGMLLHSFLSYFAQKVVAMPVLSPMPQGKGAVVMNWHVDDRRALTALERAEELGAFTQGPYSIHLTVGPDVNEEGDGKGMDLANNPDAQSWVQRLSQAGHTLGSHGGWIHNWFGLQVGKLDHAIAGSLIERNAALLLQFGGKPIQEYSAPVGNHPAWVTAWLQAHKIPSYYFTGNTGMAPTRSYQDGKIPAATVWSYPVLNFGAYASFEEAKAGRVEERDVAAWLTDVSSFSAEQHTLRLVYFHPIGLVMYPQAFQRWLAHSQTLAEAGRFHWMTMHQYTDFANRRLAVRWSVKPSDSEQRPALALLTSPDIPLSHDLNAQHPQTLDSMTWLLPRLQYGPPQILEGQAHIAEQADQWRITATGGQQLRVRLPLTAQADQHP